MNTLNILQRVLIQVKSYWPHLAGVFLLDLLAAPIALLLPVPLKVVVDNVLGSHALPPLLAALVPDALTGPTALVGLAVSLLVFLTMLSLVQALAANVLREYAGGKVALDFRSQLFEHVQQLSLGHVDGLGAVTALALSKSDLR